MEEGEEFYYSTPEEIDRLLHKFIKTNTVCVYLKTIDSNNNEVKVGVENGFPLRSWFPHTGSSSIERKPSKRHETILYVPGLWRELEYTCG